MFLEDEMVQEFCEAYDIPEEDMLDLLEYAHGNGAYVVIRDIGRAVIAQCRNEREVDAVLAPVLGVSAPVDDERLSALQRVMEAVERWRRRCGAPVDEFVEDITVEVDE